MLLGYDPTLCAYVYAATPALRYPPSHAHVMMLRAHYPTLLRRLYYMMLRTCYRGKEHIIGS
eukprot:768725-Rhodomonas_salina.2